jgi:hypothetical protein
MPNIIPRNANSLDSVQLWESNHVRRRKEELIEAHLTELIDADVQKEGLEARKRFETPLPYHGDDPNYGRRTFIEQAKKSAEETFEAERKNYVSAREEQDKAMIIEIGKKLRYLVYVVDEEGKPQKLKIIQEAGYYLIHEGLEAGQSRPSMIQYVGDHDAERREQIRSLENRLLELRDFVPYYSDDTKKFYVDALDLANLEIISK